MQVSEKLRRTFWFLTRRARDTRRWGHQQKLQQADAFDRVVASGSLSAAKAVLERQRTEASSLLARRREGLLKGKPIVAAAKLVGVAVTQDLTILLDYLAANPDVAAALNLDVAKPELLAVRLDQLLSEAKPDWVDLKLDRPVNSSTSGARLSSSR